MESASHSCPYHASLSLFIESEMHTCMCAHSPSCSGCHFTWLWSHSSNEIGCVHTCTWIKVEEQEYYLGNVCCLHGSGHFDQTFQNEALFSENSCSHYYFATAYGILFPFVGHMCICMASILNNLLHFSHAAIVPLPIEFPLSHMMACRFSGQINCPEA